MIIFYCGFSAQVNCTFLLQKHIGIITIKHILSLENDNSFHLIDKIKILRYLSESDIAMFPCRVTCAMCNC